MELLPKQEERVIKEKVYKNGDVYIGEFLKGMRDGEGTLKYADGETYQGGFKKGKMHGPGKHSGLELRKRDVVCVYIEY